VCAFIGTRDLIQEHIAFRVWPLVENWEMSKDTVAESSEGGLVRLKYTFRFREKFHEPDDDWLKCIEATSDELLGTYPWAEDDALSTAVGGQANKRLNRVFDAIGFVYPDYRYSLRGQGKKRKTAALATTVVPKGKKVKVLTQRPRYIEPAVVPEFGEGASSTAEARQAAPIMQSIEEPTIVPKVPTVGPAEAKNDKAEEPQVEKIEKVPEILSPPAETKLLKVQKAHAATPKRRRMASVLDTVLETTKALSPRPIKKNAEAAKVQDEAEAGPSAPVGTKAVPHEDKADQQTADIGMAARQDMAEKAKPSVPEALIEDIDYIFRHASGKKLSEEEIVEARHYAQKLKYPKGALVFIGSNEDDFLYCLPDYKEMSVCQEIAKSMGFPKLEEGISVMSKDDLADSLAYNSIKVRKLTLKLGMKYFTYHAQFFLLLRRV
jgi:hypothetical protein